MNISIDALLQAAETAADAAAAITLAAFRTPLHVENKLEAGFDPVTKADRDAEAVIKQVLKDAFPDIGFKGEESPERIGGSDLTWVVDPIDGTRAFITGMPLWGTLIALSRQDRVFLGLIDQPFLQERYIGHSGRAFAVCQGDRRTLSSGGCVELEKAIVQTTSPTMFKTVPEQKRFAAVADAVRLVRFGGDCYAYAMLASGYVDLVIEADLQPYDVQALIPIVEGAGGVISNWNGEHAADGGTLLAAATSELHAQALRLLRGV
ncbi:MAG: histidinol-phosphatase [Gammaproteobacteria bacterium]|nr:histidinol-phosphatase [Gammaproteobacteria bacterium]